MGTGVLRGSTIMNPACKDSNLKKKKHPPIEADKNRTCDRLVDHSIDEISSNDKSTDASNQPEDSLWVRSEKKDHYEIWMRLMRLE